MGVPLKQAEGLAPDDDDEESYEDIMEEMEDFWQRDGVASCTSQFHIILLIIIIIIIIVIIMIITVRGLRICCKTSREAFVVWPTAH
jgi:hypothetical protein